MDSTVKITPQTSSTPRGILLGRVLSLILLVFGTLVSIGWAFNVTWLRGMVPDEAYTPSSFGLELIVLSVSMLLLSGQHVVPKRIGQVLSTLSFAACALMFTEDVGGFSWHTAHTLVSFDPYSRGLTFPGPMAPLPAFLFALTSVSCALENVWIKRFLASECVGALVLVLALLTLIGNACGATRLCTGADCITTTFIDSVAYAALAAACLLVRCDRGVTAAVLSFVTANTISGLLARRFAVLLVGIPALRWVCTLAEKAGLFDSALANAVFILLIIILSSVLVAYSMAKFRGVETSKEKTELSLQEKSKRVEELSQQIARSIEEAKRRIKHVCLVCERQFDADTSICPYDGEKLARLTKKHAAGEMFANRYLLQDTLGEGGMGAVFKAEHVSMRKIVAIKVISSNLITDAQQVRRLQLEARAAGSLKHPNLVSVYDFDITEDGEAYMVMDCLNGESLSKWLKSGPLTPDHIVDILSQVCDGLEHAHEHGIVHRDLKPGNIMLAEENGAQVVKIVDFGIAKHLNCGQTEQLTGTGELVGSPLYMSPEQCLGTALDARSDIYSLGCIMFECITGHPPFTGDNVFSTLTMHLENEPEFQAHETPPEWLAAIILRCLRKEPYKRFQSAAEVKQALVSQAITI